MRKHSARFVSLEEVWLPVRGRDGEYEVSNLGRVRSLARVVPRRDRYGNAGTLTVRERVLRPSTAGRYLHVQLGANNSAKVHTLVLEAFVGPRPDGLVACHNNGNSKDNRAENLRWDTLSANQLDSVRHGTKRNGTTGATHCKRGHPFDEQNTKARGGGGRSCRACGNASKRARRASRASALVGVVAFTSAAWISMPASASASIGYAHVQVEVCHRPGSPAEKSLTVDESAVPGHLGHGDYLGECTVEPEPTPEPTPTPEPEPTPEPTEEPTPEPTEEPVIEPTEEPTEEPVEQPTPPVEAVEEPAVPVTPVVSDDSPTTHAILAETGADAMSPWLVGGALALMAGGITILFRKRATS